jgi:Right handed beta helix region
MKLRLPLPLSLLLLFGCVEVRHRAIPQQGTPCETAEQCPAEKAVCDVGGSGVCVECLPESANACSGNRPICGEDAACRGCQAHSDCASDACLPEGSCAEEDKVVFLKEGGTSGGPGNTNGKCSKETPCGTMAAALLQLTSARPYLRVTGTITSVGSILTARTITMLGSPGAVLKGSTDTDDPSILDLRTGSKVEIHDLTLQDTARNGVRVADASTLLFHRSKLLNTKLDGILVETNGSAEISQSEISNCGTSLNFGVTLNTGSLTITRSKLANNSGGVFVGEGQRFTISDSFIVGSKVIGGIYAKKPGAGSKLERSTIADNKAATTSASYAGGIYCDDASFTFSSNILFRNTGGAGGFLQNAGACKLTGSLVSSNSQAETGSLGFRSNTAPFDYHLTAASPPTVLDAGGACTGVDYDGDVRGEDGGCDLGADEYRP